MLNDEICKLREKLNNSIINGDDYEITYYATDCSGNEGAFLVHIIVGDIDHQK